MKNYKKKKKKQTNENIMIRKRKQRPVNTNNQKFAAGIREVEMREVDMDGFA